MVGSRRQGWAIFGAMFVLFVVSVVVVYLAELHGTPAQHAAGVTRHRRRLDGGNLEGKEQRFGIADSALWTAVTTVTSCGAVNAAFESLTGIGGLVPMVEPRLRRGGLRRRRHRPLHDAALRPARRLHRRPDGRPHAGVPGQEDRGARDQARRRSALLFTPLAVAASPRALAIGDQVRRAVDLRLRPAGLQRVAVRLHVAGQQQRLGVRRLHRLLPAQRPATSAPTASRSPTCSAA